MKTLKNACQEVRSESRFASIKVKDSPYGYMRIPAILFGCIGILGILTCKVEAFAIKFSFLNLPEEWACYLITIGALVLFGTSMIYKQSEKEIDYDGNVSMQLQENWRSM